MSFMDDPHDLILHRTTLLWDAMFTLFRPRINGKLVSREALEGHYYRQAAGLDDDSISDREIAFYIREERNRMSPIQFDDRYWEIVNTFVFAHMLDTSLSSRQKLPFDRVYARRVASGLISNTANFFVPQDVKEVMLALKKLGCRHLIASNHSEAGLNALLEQDRRESEEADVPSLLSLIDEVYTSEALRVSKPDPRFWDILLEVENISACEVVHIGNSARSDISAAKRDIRVVLYDTEGLLGNTQHHAYYGHGLRDDEAAELRRHYLSGAVVIVQTVEELQDSILMFCSS